MYPVTYIPATPPPVQLGRQAPVTRTCTHARFHTRTLPCTHARTLAQTRFTRLGLLEFAATACWQQSSEMFSTSQKKMQAVSKPTAVAATSATSTKPADRPAPSAKADRPAPSVKADRPAPSVKADRPAPSAKADRPAPSAKADGALQWWTVNADGHASMKPPRVWVQSASRPSSAKAAPSRSLDNDQKVRNRIGC